MADPWLIIEPVWAGDGLGDGFGEDFIIMPWLIMCPEGEGEGCGVPIVSAVAVPPAASAAISVRTIRVFKVILRSKACWIRVRYAGRGRADYPLAAVHPRTPLEAFFPR